MEESTNYLTVPALGKSPALPTTISSAGQNVVRRYLEFFAVQIRNKGTRAAYLQAINQFFDWCHQHQIGLSDIQPIVIGTYVEWLSTHLAPPTVKLHLAAIRMLFDYFVTGQIVPFNPAASVKGPRLVVRTGKTPVLDAEEARQWIESIDVSTIIGLRDRALIGGDGLFLRTH